MLRKTISLEYGVKKASEIVGKITKAIRGLVDNEKKGPSAEEMFEVPTDYRYLFILRNYVFYRIEERCIYIANIYNEKEDFMWQLFGIDTTPQETIEYWQE